VNVNLERDAIDAVVRRSIRVGRARESIAPRARARA
jgi:hypothetical protein